MSIQGTVELQRASQAGWLRVTRLDTPLCQGDRLLTAPASRAAVFIYPETLLRLDQNSSLTLNITAQETIAEFAEPPAKRDSIGKACGAGYFITRFPRKFKVGTPLLNAAVEGTEFLVALRCETAELSVLEGKVTAEAAGTTAPVTLESGQRIETDGGGMAPIQAIARPADAVQWALYYPPLADTNAAADPACLQPSAALPSRCLIARAEGALRVGRVEEALAELEQVLAAEPTNADALALRAIVEVVKGDKTAALSTAQHAVQAAPDSARAWLAHSYALQAGFDLEAAFQSATKAAALAPDSSLIHARLAELNLSLGRGKAAQAEAREAISLDPNGSRGYVVSGFVNLTRLDAEAARRDFQLAIERDPADPLARLGLGLATIRKGNLKAGREQIEIAVALDPTNALVRSYMGKAYYEENTQARDALATTQFDLAKSLDRNDPTPWLYDAILKQTQNRPVEALQDLQTSIALNDNRAVYRSRLSLDADEATRNTSLARIYDEVGLSQLAVTEAAHSLSFDPGNTSAHRFLSDAYTRAPRYEIARVSELLQAQLLQDVSLQPAAPSTPFGDLRLAPINAPLAPGLGEYSSLFERNRVQVLASGLVGNNGTLGDELVVSGLYNRLSLSLGQYHYETDGFRPNNDLEHDIYNAFVQVAPTPALNLQAELRHRRSEFGDIVLNFDPESFSPNNRRDLDQDMARVGGRVGLSANADLLASVIYLEQEATQVQFLPVPFPPGSKFTERSEQRGYLAELQVLARASRANAVLGGGHYDVTDESQPETFIPLPPPGTTIPGPAGTFKRRQSNGYGYANLVWPRIATWTLGLAYDEFEDEQNDLSVRQWSPKLGLQIRPSDRVTLRFAAFETVKRALLASQTIEPTQVAGFNQFFDDFNGTKTKRVGFGIDLTPVRNVQLGLELTKRELEAPVLAGSTLLIEDRDEQLHRAYAVWMPSARWALGVEYQYDDFQRDPVTHDQNPIAVLTRRLPVWVRYFHPRGFFGYASLMHVIQEVDRFPEFAATPGLGEGHESFNLLDVGIGYRVPGRRLLVQLDCQNCTDEKFRYQDDNFRTPEVNSYGLYPTRTLLLRAALRF